MALWGLVALIGLVPVFAWLPGQAAGRIGDSTPVSQAQAEWSAAAVLEYVDNELPGDVYVEFDGLFVKESNFYGIMLGDQNYYYCLAPHMCNCPVCRGVLDATEVEVVYTDESSGFLLVVYIRVSAIDIPAIETSVLTLH